MAVKSPTSKAVFACLIVTSIAVMPAAAQRQLKNAPGYIDFQAAGLPPASVEVDLSQGIFGDLFGLGDAALAGISSALTEPSSGGQVSEATLFAAKQIHELRSVMPLAKDVIREVRVRAYEGRQDFSEMSEKLEPQLQSGNWQRVVKVREGNMAANVSLLRSEGKIQGVFVVASEEAKTIVANLVCDVSPEKAEKLAAALTKIGLDAGLRKELEQKLRHLNE